LYLLQQHCQMCFTAGLQSLITMPAQGAMLSVLCCCWTARTAAAPAGSVTSPLVCPVEVPLCGMFCLHPAWPGFQDIIDCVFETRTPHNRPRWPWHVWSTWSSPCQLQQVGQIAFVHFRVVPENLFSA
jgi:hypothetical protein